MNFILNDTYGINGIDIIDLREVIEVFGNPDRREIIREDESRNFTVNYEYKDIDLKIFYNAYYFVDNDEIEFQTLSFIVEKLYLTETMFIESGEEMGNVLDKIKDYHKKVNKVFEYEHKEDIYSGSYDFINLDITVYFDITDSTRYMEDVYVSLPYEDDPEVPDFEDILYME